MCLFLPSLLGLGFYTCIYHLHTIMAFWIQSYSWLPGVSEGVKLLPFTPKEECYTFSIRLSATLLYTVTSLVLARGCLAPSVSQSTDKEPAWFAKKMKLAGNIQLRMCLLETTVGLQICMSNVKTWIAPATSLLQNSCRPKPSTSCQCWHINDLPQVGVHPLLAVGTGYTENASGDFTQHPTIHWWQKSRRILRQRLDLTAPSVPHNTALSPCPKAQSGCWFQGPQPSVTSVLQKAAAKTTFFSPTRQRGFTGGFSPLQHSLFPAFTTLVTSQHSIICLSKKNESSQHKRISTSSCTWGSLSGTGAALHLT